jgi:hypothetical protein
MGPNKACLHLFSEFKTTIEKQSKDIHLPIMSCYDKAYVPLMGTIRIILNTSNIIQIQKSFLRA